MTTIRESIKMGEVISFVRSVDDAEIELFYDDAENVWYLATADREEYIMIGTDEDLDELYNFLKHIVEDIPWEDDWEPEETGE